MVCAVVWRAVFSGNTRRPTDTGITDGESRTRAPTCLLVLVNARLGMARRHHSDKAAGYRRLYTCGATRSCPIPCSTLVPSTVGRMESCGCASTIFSSGAPIATLPSSHSQAHRRHPRQPPSRPPDCKPYRRPGPRRARQRRGRPPDRRPPHRPHRFQPRHQLQGAPPLAPPRRSQQLAPRRGALSRPARQHCRLPRLLPQPEVRAPKRATQPGIPTTRRLTTTTLTSWASATTCWFRTVGTTRRTPVSRYRSETTTPTVGLQPGRSQLLSVSRMAT